MNTSGCTATLFGEGTADSAAAAESDACDGPSDWLSAAVVPRVGHQTFLGADALHRALDKVALRDQPRGQRLNRYCYLQIW